MAAKVLTMKRRLHDDLFPSGFLAAICIGAALIPFAVIAVQIVHYREWAHSPGGDLALIELAVREAANGERLVGHYSKNLFFHPGPLPFYLLLPAYQLLGGGVAGLYLGALGINAVATVGLVATMWRAGGVRAAVCSSAAIALLVALAPKEVAYPWNPLYTVIPTAVCLAACATAISRHPVHLITAAIAASFVAQSHIGPAPMCAVLLAAASVVSIRRHGSIARRPILMACGVLGLLWLPTILEAAQPGRSNVTQTLAALADGSDRVSLWTACSLFVRNVVTFPFLPDRYVKVVDHASFGHWTVAIAVIAMVVAATVRSARKRQRFTTDLGALSLLALAVSFVSTFGTMNPASAYLVHWIAGISVVMWISITLCWIDVMTDLLSARPQWVRLLPHRSVMAVVLVVLVSAWSAETTRSSYPDLEPWMFDPTFGLATPSQRVIAELDRLDVDDVDVVIGVMWERGANLVLGLERSGRTVSVEAHHLMHFGPRLAPDGDAPVLVELFSSPDEAATARPHTTPVYSDEHFAITLTDRRSPDLEPPPQK